MKIKDFLDSREINSKMSLGKELAYRTDLLEVLFMNWLTICTHLICSVVLVFRKYQMKNIMFNCPTIDNTLKFLHIAKQNTIPSIKMKALSQKLLYSKNDSI